MSYVKDVTVADWLTKQYKPAHPERTAYKARGFSYSVYEFPTRAAMIKAIDAQFKHRGPSASDLTAFPV